MIVCVRDRRKVYIRAEWLINVSSLSYSLLQYWISLCCYIPRSNTAVCHNRNNPLANRMQVLRIVKPRSPVAKNRCALRTVQACGNTLSIFDHWLWQSVVPPFSLWQSADITPRIAMIRRTHLSLAKGWNLQGICLTIEASSGTGLGWIQKSIFLFREYEINTKWKFI
jgi:hypothetical protein